MRGEKPAPSDMAALSHGHQRLLTSPKERLGHPWAPDQGSLSHRAHSCCPFGRPPRSASRSGSGLEKHTRRPRNTPHGSTGMRARSPDCGSSQGTNRPASSTSTVQGNTGRAGRAGRRGGSRRVRHRLQPGRLLIRAN